MPNDQPAMHSRKIPPRLWAQVLKHRGDGDSADKIAARLKLEHGIEITPRSVNRLLVRLQQQQDQVVVAALQQMMLDVVPGMLEKATRASRTLDKLIRGETDTAKVAAGLRSFADALDKVAKLGGVSTAQTLDVTTGGKRLALYLPDET